MKKIQVSVYYETLCGDSVAFLRDQLYPTWQKRRDEMDIKLVPYGKAAVCKSQFKRIKLDSAFIICVGVSHSTTGTRAKTSGSFSVSMDRESVS